SGTASAGLRSGRPPLVFDFGVRKDPEAVALRRAQSLYSKGRQREAGAVFARYSSLQARVGAAVAAWPDGTLAALDRLAREHPQSGLVRLHLGLALPWSRRGAAALVQWPPALRADPASPA